MEFFGISTNRTQLSFFRQTGPSAQASPSASTSTFASLGTSASIAGSSRSIRLPAASAESRWNVEASKVITVAAKMDGMKNFVRMVILFYVNGGGFVESNQRVGDRGAVTLASSNPNI